MILERWPKAQMTVVPGISTPSAGVHADALHWAMDFCLSLSVM